MTFSVNNLLTEIVVSLAGYARKTTQTLADVDPCAADEATGARWSRSSIAVIASISGAATSSVKPVRAKSKSADVTKRTCRQFFAYLLATLLASSW